MNEYKLSDIQIGMEVTFNRVMTLEMENAFREISGDENPLHKDDEFARSVSRGKYQSHISFGMLTASLYSTLAGVYLPGINSLLHSFEEISFLKPVVAGDKLTVTGEVVDKIDDLKLIRIKAAIRNQNSQLVSRAKMKVLVLQ